jgi:hypothetical protein
MILRTRTAKNTKKRARDRREENDHFRLWRGKNVPEKGKRTWINIKWNKEDADEWMDECSRLEMLSTTENLCVYPHRCSSAKNPPRAQM